MIVVSNGTTFLTAEAFRARFDHTVPGATFPYASGNLIEAADREADARELRRLVGRMEAARKISLMQRPRPGLNMFDYFATRQKA